MKRLVNGRPIHIKQPLLLGRAVLCHDDVAEQVDCRERASLRIEALEHLLRRVVFFELDRDHAQPVESPHDGIGVDGGLLDLLPEELISFDEELGQVILLRSWNAIDEVCHGWSIGVREHELGYSRRNVQVRLVYLVCPSLIAHVAHPVPKCHEHERNRGKPLLAIDQIDLHVARWGIRVATGSAGLRTVDE